MPTLMKKFSLLICCIAFVGFLGCAGEEPATPEPPPPGAAENTPGDAPEQALEEGGADAALPPDQQTE